ncbi:hypothetical protein TREMEDRAFT_37110 [Tremella mesenterica DSM 1558]|uniref:uncharacterized protein n=1 Tax=Tremella mesenterica (strain ATCC 24925 / CBS 8224 / DSM 1558 / NBRC 9311 / NRRL Y-6157 / RJB 2259-6 / UBC 559-6) TaxID=578456 RepID=UPI0003F49C12|nr:uncharacterized protein TREMEDRAFT_37110 [Tremella mesenterica DSM 1558]EIW73015.1 hypothetical protein TREMEDRAFT_37110 [Tremella mesenterica DSM 1558]
MEVIKTPSEGSRDLPPSLELGQPSAPNPSAMQRATVYLHQEVDPKACNPVSIYACFINGFTAAPTFSACFIWCGFQTGNVAQLGLALARTFAPTPERTYGFQKPDQQAFVSLAAFLAGTSLGRIGDHMGARRRSWLFLSAAIQVLLTIAGTLCAHFSEQNGVALDRDHPSWTNALGMLALAFLSATIGLQGIVGKRVGSPMNTTVVLTTTWVELFNDPLLLSLRPTPSRDIRAAGVFMVFVGSFCARAILQSRAGSAGALGVLAGLRALQAVWWICIRPKPLS